MSKLQLSPSRYDVAHASTQKLVLHSAVSDEAFLEAIVERCLADGVSLLAIFGPGSDVLEEKVDWQ